MNTKQIMKELAQLGNESIKKTFIRHGAREPFFGVKIADLKKFQKAIKKDYQLSLELYDTGNSDAMYLAGLIADESQMTKEDLNKWVKQAYWNMISEYTVAWIAAESNYGYELARQWIESEEENIAAAGWSTLGSLVAIKPDNELKIDELEVLLERVGKTIHEAQNRVRYTMNGYVIALGAYVASLTDKSMKIAKQIGKVNVDMGGTACKVPLASEYIDKIKKMNRIGKKKKMARC